MTTTHTLIPLRQFRATAPSGGQVTFLKFSEGERELSFYHGLLSVAEDVTFWSAKLAAERSGIEKWEKAIAILVKAGWRIVEDVP